MYSPSVGRFLQPDAIGYAGGMNLYAYVAGDPINLNDPFGYDCNTGSWVDCPPTRPDFLPFPSRFSPISDYDIWLADQRGGFVVGEQVIEVHQLDRKDLCEKLGNALSEKVDKETIKAALPDKSVWKQLDHGIYGYFKRLGWGQPCGGT